jgi:hypothetical protein
VSGMWDCFGLAQQVGKCHLPCTHLKSPVLNPPDLVIVVSTVIESEASNLNYS